MILAIDQGTTGTTVGLVNTQGALIAAANTDFTQQYPKPGWVEHDAEEIYQSFLLSLEKVKKLSPAAMAQVQVIGITNQRETIVAWHRKTGKPLAPAIVWQCRRTAAECLKLKPKFEKKIRKITGLFLDPYFSATKMAWLLKNNKAVSEAAKQNELCFGTIDSFLVFRLTAGQVHATDVSNASRTMLMDLKTLSWSRELLQIFKITEQSLPQIKASNASFGVTSGVAGLPNGISIHGVIGDQQAALFGQKAFLAGEAKCTFGTGSFILINTGAKIRVSRSKLLTTVAWSLENKKGERSTSYALEGGAFVCGAAVQWLKEGLKIISSSSEVEALAQTVSDSGGVQFVPALTGLGAPHWNAEARGLITGLTRGSTSAHIARATLEAMALQNVDILLAMQKDAQQKMKTLKVDGGATENNLLMQMQADFLGVKVERPQQIETTTLGAALIAGLGFGLWKHQSELRAKDTIDQIFKPTKTTSQRLNRLKVWHQAIGRAL